LTFSSVAGTLLVVESPNPYLLYPSPIAPLDSLDSLDSYLDYFSGRFIWFIPMLEKLF